MCRYLAYLGPPRRLSSLIYKPPNGLVHQASAAMQSLTRINADGFGVGWYAPKISAEPAVFKDTTPVWNNHNLGSIAGKIRSSSIVAHIRAARKYDPVNRENCHPFARGRLLWMHNGDIPRRARLTRHVTQMVDDTLLALIRGNTDSELAFSVFLSHLEDPLARNPDVAELTAAMDKTIGELAGWHLEDTGSRPLELNFCVTDGAAIVATRFALGTHPPTVHWNEGGSPDAKSVTVASEPLDPSETWLELGEGKMLVVSTDLEVERRQLRAATPVGH